MQRILQKIGQFIQDYNMISAGDHVVAGVSGGADSLCLLIVLLNLREAFGHTVSVVHIDHGIRGQASMRDAEFVSHFCRERSIECHIRRYFVPEYAKEHGMGEEEAGRALRYTAFQEEKQAVQQKYPGMKVKIAVAHNLEDNAETMLLHLARGSGIHGLCGIAPVRGDIIRPLLAISRAEIESCLAGLQQEFCTDATNGDDRYSRNRLRHHALPALVGTNSRAIWHMYEAAQKLGGIAGYLERQAAGALTACCTYGEGCVIVRKDAFACQDPVIQKEMLWQLLMKLSGSGKNITNEHVLQVAGLFGKQNGRQAHLPYGINVVRIYSGIALSTVNNAEKESKAGPDIRKEQFSFRIIENFSDYIPQISKKKYTKCFDYDKIKAGFCIRSRQPGDYLAVDASGNRQKLKKYLVNEKIPQKEREKLLLLADGQHIMWVVGYRISSYYKVNANTRKILEVTFYGGKEDE